MLAQIAIFLFTYSKKHVIINYMKQKIKIIDKVSGKIVEKEVELRNLDHFNVQLRNRAHIYRNKKVYTRKRKHKNENE